ncbi:hypothetical protein E2562_006560 [Oryza meyeriana var. granulata]|uniref:MLLE-like domain-containing protein n=1 Tax=Oryza meyeriana var. granulata TaxID=110450 RepID=A0A6G1EFN3_9ORYZ|nr:hypothetical protein E2562_006560 [Oryza meyeriana var. granulata]
MELLGSLGIVHGRGKNKRIWTYIEDEELIKALFELSLDPSWKSEGGFKNRYCEVLEGVLVKKLPGCGLTAVPHIESRKNNEVKGLYGVAFPHYDTLAAIYGRDIATGEGGEGLSEAVANMEKEIVIQDVEDEEDEESAQMSMLLALPESLRREYMLKMLTAKTSIFELLTLLPKLRNEELCKARVC